MSDFVVVESKFLFVFSDEISLFRKNEAVGVGTENEVSGGERDDAIGVRIASYSHAFQAGRVRVGEFNVSVTIVYISFRDVKSVSVHGKTCDGFCGFAVVDGMGDYAEQIELEVPGNALRSSVGVDVKGGVGSGANVGVFQHPLPVKVTVGGKFVAGKNERKEKKNGGEMFDFHVKSVGLLDEQTKFSRWFSEEASGFGECELEPGVVADEITAVQGVAEFCRPTLCVPFSNLFGCPSDLGEETV